MKEQRKQKKKRKREKERKRVREREPHHSKVDTYCIVSTVRTLQYTMYVQTSNIIVLIMQAQSITAAQVLTKLTF